MYAVIFAWKVQGHRKEEEEDICGACDNGHIGTMRCMGWQNCLQDCPALLELSGPETSPECANAKDLPLRAWKPGEGGQPWSRAGHKDSYGIAAKRQCSGNQCM